MSFTEYPIAIPAGGPSREPVGTFRCFRLPCLADVVDAIWDCDIPDGVAARGLAIKHAPGTSLLMMAQYRVAGASLPGESRSANQIRHPDSEPFCNYAPERRPRSHHRLPEAGCRQPYRRRVTRGFCERQRPSRQHFQDLRSVDVRRHADPGAHKFREDRNSRVIPASTRSPVSRRHSLPRCVMSPAQPHTFGVGTCVKTGSEFPAPRTQFQFHVGYWPEAIRAPRSL